MNKISLYLVVMLLYVSAQALFAQSSDIFYHTVERGQTVYSISVMYGVGEEDIYRLNPSSREVIKAGEILKIPQKESATTLLPSDDDMYIYHTIAQGETMYSVSRRYSISVESLSEANQGLTPEGFATGKTIRIPSMQIQSLPATQTKVVVKELQYKVARRETMYSIARKFDVTSEELLQYNPQLKSGLKAGMTLTIPVKTEEIVTETPEQKELNINELINYRRDVQRTNVAKIGLLLPFLQADSRTPVDHRVTEFYEGFLMAIDSVKNTGMSVELFVYDIGNDLTKTREALTNEELQTVHLLIGGLTDEQIEMIATFAKNNEIKYVIPFSARCEKVTMNNPYVFQVNATPQNLYSYATLRIRNMFPDYHIILLNTGDKDPKTLFMNILKADLSDNGIQYKELTYNEKTFAADMQASLSNVAPNLIIPVSGSLDALMKIKGTLRSITETKPEYAITLFGHPEWQNYMKDCLEDFYALNAYFYAASYMNTSQPAAKRFSDKYKTLYHKPLADAYPRYAVLGYDLGMYLLTSIRSYGTGFEDYISQINYNSLQSGLRFARVSNWGGLFNTNLFIVHYDKQGFTITRED